MTAFAAIWVSTHPGTIALTRIPAPASSSAAHRVMPRTTHMLAWYGMRPGAPPIPAMDDMLIIDPDRAARIVALAPDAKLGRFARAERPVASVAENVAAGVPGGSPSHRWSSTGQLLTLHGRTAWFGVWLDAWAQREDTPCRPRSPYATAKLAAHQLVGQLRERHGLFAVSGILYNHESERRPDRFVTRKITRGAAEIALGRRRTLSLGDLSAVRDWSFAGDVMHGLWLALRHETPQDYIFASGVGHTVEQFVNAAFAHLGLDPAGHLEVDPSLLRAPEAVAPVGDPRRARETLGWAPTIGFEQLVARMVDADVAELSV